VVLDSPTRGKTFRRSRVEDDFIMAAKPDRIAAAGAMGDLK
jgi:hypothetical protein